MGKQLSVRSQISLPFVLSRALARQVFESLLAENPLYNFTAGSPTANHHQTLPKSKMSQLGLLRWVENLGIGLPVMQRRDDSTASLRRAR